MSLILTIVGLNLPQLVEPLADEFWLASCDKTTECT
jgi:hypothetical protein